MSAQLLYSSRYDFNALAIQSQVVAFAAFCLGVFMLGRELDRRLRTAFFLLTTSVSIWLFADSFMYASLDERTAMAWAKTAYFGIAFIPAAYYHFSAFILRDYDAVRGRVFGAWAVSALFLALILSTDLIFGTLYRYSWGWFPKYGLSSVPFLLYFIGMVSAVLLRLRAGIRAAKKGSATTKRAKGILTAFMVGGLACCDFLPLYGIDLYPFGYIPILFFIVIAAYLTAKRRFPELHPNVVLPRIIDTMQDALIVLDREGIVRLVNHATCALFGKSEKDLAGKSLAEGLPDDVQFAVAFEFTIRSDWRHDHELAFVRPDGSPRTLSVSVAIIQDRSGDALFFVCILRDITKRMQDEQALKENNAVLARQLNFTRTLLETQPVAVFFKDTEGRYLGCNGEFSKIIGVSPGDIKGKTVFDLWPPELAERYHEQDMALLGNPGHQVYEFKVKHAQGGMRDVIFNKDVFNDENGKVQGIIGTFFDITERKEAEDKITRLNTELEQRVAERTELLKNAITHLQREIEEHQRAEEDLKTNRVFLHNILNSIQDPIAVLDRNRNLLLTNKTFETAFTEGRHTDFLGKSCHEILFGSVDACGVCLAEQSSLTGTVSHKVISSEGGPDGPKWYDVFAYPLFTADGRVVGNVHHLRDITEHRRAEEKIVKDQEQLRSLTHQLLTSEERERKRIARELHDEMGQMLTGIKLSLQEIRQQAGGDIAIKVGAIQQDMGDLMTRIRELSARLRPSMLDDLGLLPALQWHIERFTKQTGVRVEFEHRGLGGELPHEVSLTLFRVVQEALTNAVRHSGADSVAIEIKAGKGIAGATIRDKGVGFDPDHVLGRGTTLGLAGMRERVEMAGGTLTIRSARNAGTEIACEIPISHRASVDERKA